MVDMDELLVERGDDAGEGKNPLSRGALRHEVVRHLLGEIFRGKLPTGTRLIVLKLAERFGLSSTPVREALVELESLGMIRVMHNRGAVVKPFGVDQLREIYQVRRVLEAEAARTACGRIDRQALQDLEREMRDLAGNGQGRGWSERALLADGRMHELITLACGNSRLSEEIRQYQTLVQAVREVVGHNRKAQQQAVQDHLAILDAILAGDADAVAAAMSRHIENSEWAARQVMFPSSCK